jgi:hypothetical protein
MSLKCAQNEPKMEHVSRIVVSAKNLNLALQRISQVRLKQNLKLATE